MVSFLSSDIGRGHPFYLDGVIGSLRSAGRDDLVGDRTTVFEISRGLSQIAWRAARSAYRLAGSGGWRAGLYDRLRSNASPARDSIGLRVLGRDLRRWAGARGPLVVDHPVLVGALRGYDPLWYVHGELVAPAPSLVPGATRVLVPTQQVAAGFASAGVPISRLLVTGACVDPLLLEGARERAAERRQRLAGSEPLTVGFFSSGAEPVRHVGALAAGAAALAASRHRAVVFAERSGRLERAVAGATDGARPAPEVVSYEGREELDRRTADRFPELDVVVSPPHERANWAVALGVPFVLVGPDIGPFAPLNRALLLERGVAVELRSAGAARELPLRLDRLRTGGTLAAMSERGLGLDAHGFARAARAIVTELGG